jgi:hypothetical protein
MEKINSFLNKFSFFLQKIPFDESYLKFIFNAENEKDPLILLLKSSFTNKLNQTSNETRFNIYYIVFTLLLLTKIMNEEEKGYFNVDIIFKAEKVFLDFHEKIKKNQVKTLSPVELRSIDTIKNIISSTLNDNQHIFSKEEIKELILIISKIFLEDNDYNYILKVISIPNIPNCQLFNGYTIELDKAINISEIAYVNLLNNLKKLNQIKVLVLIEVKKIINRM